MKSSKWLWAGVALVFVLMACAWTAMFVFSRQAHVESVPLASGGRAGPPGPPSESATPQTQSGGPGGTALPAEESP
jgi:hypothetical protein